jgi:hypothetical protein
VNTADIDYVEYESLLKKQKQDHATEEEKYKIGKFCIMEKLGVSSLDVDILKKFNKNSLINNYLGLLSTNNLKSHKDINDLAPERVKTNIIKQFLKNIGFKTLDAKNKINGKDLEKILLKMVKRKDDIFNKKKENKAMFKTVNKKLDSFKGILGYINTILKCYSLKLESSRERDGGEDKITFYELQHSNGIQDIIKFKFLNGFQLQDDNNIIIGTENRLKDETFEMWGHLRENKERIITDNTDNIIDTSLLDIGLEIN